MQVVLEGFAQGASSGTWRVLDGGADSASPLASYNADGSVHLPKTGHDVPAATSAGEGLAYYFRRVAAQIGANPDLDGAILLMGDTYNIGRTGDPVLDLAVHVDAFANAPAYGLGNAGAPPVVAGPAGLGNPGTGGPDPVEVGGDNLFVGKIRADSVDTPWVTCNPQQVNYALVEQDGLYSAVCDGSVPVYGGVGFPPGVATFADLKGAQWGAANSGDVPVKAGQYFCFAHVGAPGNRMRCSGK